MDGEIEGEVRGDVGNNGRWKSEGGERGGSNAVSLLLNLSSPGAAVRDRKSVV